MVGALVQVQGLQCGIDLRTASIVITTQNLNLVANLTVSNAEIPPDGFSRPYVFCRQWVNLVLISFGHGSAVLAGLSFVAKQAIPCSR